MAVLQGSYDEFLNALRAQATPAPTPTGGAIDLRNRLFNPTPVPTPAPAPKPRADLMLPGYAAGTSDVTPAPDTSQLPWLQRAGLGVNSFLTKMGNAQMQAADQEAAGNAAVLSAVGGGLSDLKAGLGGQTTPVVPTVTPAQAAVDAPNTTPLADRAGPSVGKQGPYPAPAPVYAGYMDPRTHSLEEFVAANKDITMREALGIMKANPQNGPQGRIQQMLLGLAEAQHARDVAAAGNDKAEQAKVDLAHMQRLGIIASGGANGAMQYNMIRSPN